MCFNPEQNTSLQSKINHDNKIHSIFQVAGNKYLIFKNSFGFFFLKSHSMLEYREYGKHHVAGSTGSVKWPSTFKNAILRDTTMLDLR